MWVKGKPTTIGIYWFYGGYRSRLSHPRIGLLSVRGPNATGGLTYILDGQFFYEEEQEGYYWSTRLPQPAVSQAMEDELKPKGLGEGGD